MQAPSTTARHLVVGEVVADVVRPRAGATQTYAGGSPANVAVGLARLGAEVTLLTQIGLDVHGDLIRAHLARSGVDVVAVPGPGGPDAATPSAVASLDETGAATYAFDIAWTMPPTTAPCTALHVHTGSIATLLAPGADAVEALVREVRRASTISFDPNIRPALVRDRHDARARVERMVALSDVVKASDEDVAYLYPDLDAVEVARDWLGRGAAVVVVTLGGAGSVCVTRDGVVTIDPTVVTVADTVGAGDSFMAALVDGLSRDGLLGAEHRTQLAAMTTEDARRLCGRASRAAAITVSRPGATPPTLEELERVG